MEADCYSANRWEKIHWKRRLLEAHNVVGKGISRSALWLVLWASGRREPLEPDTLEGNMTEATTRLEAIAHIMRLKVQHEIQLEDEIRRQALLIRIALAWLELGEPKLAEDALREARI